MMMDEQRIMGTNGRCAPVFQLYQMIICSRSLVPTALSQTPCKFFILGSAPFDTKTATLIFIRNLHCLVL